MRWRFSIALFATIWSFSAFGDSINNLVRLYPNPLRRFELKSYCKFKEEQIRFGVVKRGRFMRPSSALKIPDKRAREFRRDVRRGNLFCVALSQVKTPTPVSTPEVNDEPPILDRGLATSCNEVKLSGDEQTSEDLEVILRPNTFFDTADEHRYLNSALINIIRAHVSTMPSSLLRKVDLTDAERAAQLQSTIELANRLEVESSAGTIPKTSVKILLNPCGYDFSSTSHTTDVGTDAELTRLRPKLVIRRNHIAIEGLKNNTRLYYSGPSSQSGVTCGSDYGSCHARVILVIFRAKNQVALRGLHIEGDMKSEDFFIPERHLHENYGALTISKGRYAMVMIGYPITNSPTSNDVLVENCKFTKVNMRAVEVHGNAKIQNNHFEGTLPFPTGAPSGAYQNAFSCFANRLQSFCQPGMRGLPLSVFGMNWHSGLSLYGVGVGPTIITGNEFISFIEGIVGKHLAEASIVSGNFFDIIADHAIYLLGSTYKSDISRNYFSRVLSHVIKLGAHSTRLEPVLETGDLGPYKSTFDQNVFSRIRGSAFFMSGSYNRLRQNQMLDDVDPTGWFNREWIVNNQISRNPFVWLSTYGGNTNSNICGYFNHSAGNVISEIIATIPDIFIQQMDDSSWESCNSISLRSDRSIDANRVEGSGLVYHRARAASVFESSLSLGQDAVLQVEKYPPKCGGCARMVLN